MKNTELTNLADLFTQDLFEAGNDNCHEQQNGSVDHIKELRRVNNWQELFLNDSLFVCNPDGDEITELTYHGLGHFKNETSSYLVSTGDYSLRTFYFINIYELIQNYKCYTYCPEFL